MTGTTTSPWRENNHCQGLCRDRDSSVPRVITLDEILEVRRNRGRVFKESLAEIRARNNLHGDPFEPPPEPLIVDEMDDTQACSLLRWAWRIGPDELIRVVFGRMTRGGWER